MFLNTCRFCEHGNPTNAKFCNACGGALHLVPCPRCGAVSDVTAIACYQCHGQLPGHETNALDIPQPAVETPKALRRPRARVIFGTGIIAAIALIGYYAYHQTTYESNRASPESAGVGPGNAIAGNVTLGKRDDSFQPASTASAQPKTPLADAAPAATIQLRENRQPVESRAVKAATVPVARTKGTNEGRVSEPEQSRAVACTESVAALGLCALKPAQKTGAEAAVTIKPIVARPKTGDVGKTGQREARRQEACTDGATALGLCAPKSTHEGK